MSTDTLSTSDVPQTREQLVNSLQELFEDYDISLEDYCYDNDTLTKIHEDHLFETIQKLPKDTVDLLLFHMINNNCSYFECNKRLREKYLIEHRLGPQDICTITDMPQRLLQALSLDGLKELYESVKRKCDNVEIKPICRD